MRNNCKPQSQLRRDFSGFPTPLGAGRKRVDLSIVARVQPKTSKGITDLLLLNLVQLYNADPSKKTKCRHLIRRDTPTRAPNSNRRTNARAEPKRRTLHPRIGSAEHNQAMKFRGRPTRAERPRDNLQTN